MPLDFQLVQTPFRFGVQEGVDPKQVPFGTLLTAENVVWKKSGRLEKRQGIETIGTVEDAKRLIVRGGELAVTDGSNVYSYAGGDWIDRGRHPEVGLTWETSQDSIGGIAAADVAYLSDGTIVHAWVTGDPLDTSTGGDLYYQIIERETGAVLEGPFSISSGGVLRVRVVASGTNYAIIYAKAGNLLHRFNGITTVLQSTVQTATLLRASFDACVIGSEFVVAWALLAGGIGLARYTFGTTPAVQATGTVSASASTNINSLSIDGASGETLYVGWYDATNVLVRRAMSDPSTLVQTVATATLEAPTTPSVVTVAVHRKSSTTAVYAWSNHSGASAGRRIGLMQAVHVTSAGVAGTASYTPFLRLIGRPFTMNGRQYALAGLFVSTLAMATGEDIEGSDVFLVDVTVTDTSDAAAFRLVGKVDLLIGGVWVQGHVTNAAAVSSTEYLLASPLLSEAASNLTGWRQGFRTVTATVGASVPADMWRSVQVGPEAYIAAGVPTAYDGSEALGYGFAHPAYIDRYSSSASAAGGTMATGDYLYNVVPERRSTVGVLHRGPSAVTQSFSVIGPTGSVDLRVVPVLLSLATEEPEILAIYRSTASGEVPQRLTVEPSYDVLANELTSDSLQIVDTTIDSGVGGGSLSLDARPALYTEGGELDDFQPPALLTLCTYRNRIFGIDGSGRTIRFSKSHAANPGVAPGFHPAFRIVIDDALTALAVLDERLIIFSETGIYYLAGDGPAPNGDGPFDAPNKLQTDVGCTNPRGMVSGPDGVFFVSDGEIHMLDRSLTVQWVGKPVQDLLDAFPNVTSAVLVAAKNHVRFSCNNDAGTAGVVLVFDYVEKQWSCFKYAVSGGNGRPIADACMHGGVYTFVTTAGVVYKESDDTWFDAGQWVTAKIETAWIHAAGPLAYHSVRNFRIDGVSASEHGLSISVGFNGNTTYQQGPETWAQAVDGVTAVGDSVTANISIGNRRKCRSIRFKVEDSATTDENADFQPDGTGQGAKWSTMGIEVGVKRGPGRLAVRQKG